MAGAEIVIVGAGIVGATLGYRLAQTGAKVTIVDRGSAGGGTSANSFAWLNAFGKPPREYHRLNARSIREHRDLAEETGGDWLHLDGSIVWFDTGDMALLEQQRQKVRQLEAWGYRVEVATPAQVMRDLEPDLAIDESRVDEVYVMAGEGWLDAPRMAHALVHLATRRHGARSIRAEVVGLDGTSLGVDKVRLEDGTSLHADIVVNAAGPWAARIAALAGAQLPIRRQIGVMVVTSPAPTCLRHVVRAPESFIRPDGGGRVLLHRDQYDSEIEESDSIGLDHPVARKAIPNAMRILPGLDGVRIESVRVGMRAMPLDGLAIIGFDPRVAGLYHVVTHSGVTLSAGIARHVTEELSGEHVPELASFGPERFGASAAAPST